MSEHGLSAPCLDDHMKTAVWDPHEAPVFSDSLVAVVERLAAAVEPLQPLPSPAKERRWRIWLPLARGSLEAFACHFGALDEGETTRLSDLERRWLAAYPEALDRRPLLISRRAGIIHLSFPEDLEVWADLESRDCGGLRADRVETLDLLHWLIRAAEEEVSRILKGGDAYLAQLSREVPNRRRKGRIRRKVLMSLIPDRALLEPEGGTDPARATAEEDLIGICPCPESSPFCLCTFPPGDHIQDLAHLWMFDDDTDDLEAAIEWYPLDVSPPRPPSKPAGRTSGGGTAVG